MEVLDSGMLSTGPMVRRFEKSIEDYTGAKHAVSCNSGTSGLHLALSATLKNDGYGEIITTPHTFLATTNAIRAAGFHPRFVDVYSGTLNMNMELVEKEITDRTVAIMPVDFFAQACDMDDLKEITSRYEIPIIEDAVQGVGSFDNGVHTGRKADVGVLGFFPNKQITTGEGGCVITDDDGIAERCRQSRKHGLNNDQLCVRPGFNFKLSDVNCAIGLGQMQRIAEIAGKRIAAVKRYDELIEELEVPVSRPVVKPLNDVNPFVYIVMIQGDERDAEHRRDITIHLLRERGIACRDYFRCSHLHPYYSKSHRKSYPVAENAYRRSIALPFFSNITEEQIQYVVKNLNDILT